MIPSAALVLVRFVVALVRLCARALPGRGSRVAAWSAGIAFALFGTWSPAAVGPLTWNPATDFYATTTNPNGVWSYGWMDTGFKALTPYLNKHVNPSGYSNWYGWAGDETPAVGFNGQSVPLNNVPAGAMLLHPGNGNEPSVLRWTAPFAATIRAVGQFYAGDGGVMQVAVRHNDSALFTASDAGAFDLPVTVAAGDRIDFTVYGGYAFGSTGLQVAITATAIPLPLTTGDTGKLAIATFAGGTAVQIAATGTGDLANSSLQTNPDGSLVVAAGAPWTAGNAGAAYPNVAGFPAGDGINRFVGGGLNYDHGGGSGWMFAGKQTTDTTDPAAIRSGAVVGTFSASPTRDDWFFIGYGRTVTVPRGGATLYVAVNESNSTDNHGSYSLTVSTVAPANDFFAAAEAITSSNQSRTGTNVLATKESAEPSHASNTGGASVWWKWTAPKTGIASISTIGSTFDTLLTVYTGNAVNALTAVASDDNSGPANTSKLTFNATAGTVYAIAVDGSGGATGSIALDVGYAYHFSTFAGLAGTAGSTNATGASARFSGPNDVVVDSAGNLYVGETTNHTVRKITPAGVVTTLAGSAGLSGTADGTGADARFKQPLGLALDGSGNILVADYENHAIRHVTPAGVVTTLAGLVGTSGTDNATGTAARFNFPVGLVVDSAGNVFVADSANHVIRKIAVGGAVTTFAGTMGSPGSNDGTGTAAKFQKPYRLALDATGHLFVADTFNHTIRKITPAGVVTTLAGSPGVAGVVDGAGSAAKFNKPYGLAVDAMGNVFAADYVGHTLRKITPTGVVSTLGGLADTFGAVDGTGGVARFNAPTGVAFDAAGNLVIADFANQTIRRGSLATPPVVNSLAPTVLYAGATVTVTGTNFLRATAVSFNGTAATSFTVVSDTTITAVVPVGATAGNVTVSSPGGTSTATAAFTVITVAPTALDGFAPNAGGGNANVTQVLVAALQPDGKVIIGGNFTTLQPAGTAAAVNASRLARLNRDGTIDSTFAVSASAEVSAVAVQPDGKILVGNGGQINGISTGNLARLNSDGTRDNNFTFGASGAPRKILVLPDGKLLVAGAFFNGSIRYPLMRLFADGSIDSSFTLVPITGVLSATLTWAYDVVVQSDGKLLVGGYFWTIGGQGIHMLARLNADGTLDPSFDAGLTHSNGPDIKRIVLQPDGKILIAGRFASVAGQNWAHFARLNPDGTLDTTFPALSGVNFSGMTDCVLQADGRIVVAGGFNALNGFTRNALVRLLPDGNVDPTLTGGVANTSVESISVLLAQPDGSVLVGGGYATLDGLSRGRLARIQPAGTIERTLALDATAGVVGAFALQPNGKLILGGHFDTVGGVARPFVARLNADATLDTTFNPSPNASVIAPVVLADGRFLLGGRFSTIGGLSRNGLARFSADGVIDPTFDAAISGGVLNSVVLQSDGKIVIGGTFTSAGGQSRNRLARLNADGSLDTAFNPDVKGEVFGLALQGDGSIVFSGDFTQVGTTTRNRLARVNSAGVLDGTFDPAANNTVHAVAVQADGKLFVTGFFTTIAGESRAGYARLTATGAIDAAFNPATTAGGVTVVQADGKILVGGTFTSIAGAARGYLARLLANGTIDADFNVAADGNVGALALQSDGKILVGGDFSNIGGQARLRLARLNSTGPTSTALTATPSAVTLTRTGPLPELSWVTLEKSTDRTTWTSLGTATRMGTTASWQLTGQSIPTNTLLYLRARAAAPTGVYGASSLVEHVQQVFIAVRPEVNAVAPSTVFAGATVTLTGSGFTGATAVAFNGAAATSFTVVDDATITAVVPAAATTGNITVTGPGGTSTTAATFTAIFPAPSAQDRFDPGANGPVNTVAVQPDGKIIIGGDFTTLQPFGTTAAVTRTRLARLNRDGTVDSTFLATATVNGAVNTLALQVDGKIVLGGAFTSVNSTTRNRLARLNPDGTLDTTFDPNANNQIFAVTVQPDGQILVGGYFTTLQPNGAVSPTTRTYAARLTTTGALDATFNVAISGADTHVHAFAVQPNGAILVGGEFTTVADASRPHLVRLLSTGALDPAFTPAFGGPVDSVALQPDGKILVGGEFTTIGAETRNHLARLNVDGTLDPGFSPPVSGAVLSLALQSDGRIVVGGSFALLANTSRTALGRLLPNGALDTTFAATANNIVRALALQPDGSLLVAGDFTTLGGHGRNRLARLLPSGAVERALAPDINFDIRAIAATPDGSLLVTGDFSSADGAAVGRLIRYNADATRDLTFDPGLDDRGEAIAVMPDGKFYVAGQFTTVAGQPRRGLARFNANGTFDSSFDAQLDSSAYSLLVQPDGKLVVGGAFGRAGTVVRRDLLRLDATGALDPTFNPDVDNTVYALALQPDGKIVLGGHFTTVGGVARARIARVDATGALDSGFNPGADSYLQCAVVQPDGKILLGGYFTTVAGTARSRLARVDTTGALDTTFDPGADFQVYALALGADGAITVGGQFDTLAGASRPRLGRLTSTGALDAAFQPYANNRTVAILLQPDGKTVIGGAFSSVGGQTRGHLARLVSAAPTATAITATTSTLTLTRSGPLPELSWVTFEKSADGLTGWTSLGTASRVGATSNWQLTGQSLPQNSLFYVRARAAAPSSALASSSLVEHVQQLYLAATGPTITTQPVATTVAVGGSVTLSVTATGANDYQWVRNGNSIPNATSATLTLSPVALSHLGNYYVLVNGPGGTTQSNGVTLTVTTPTPVPLATTGGVLKNPRYLATDGTDWFVSGVRQDNTQAILKLPFAGGTVTSLYGDLPSPLSVAVLDSEVFWIDPNAGPSTDTKIQKAAKTSTGFISSLYTGSAVGEPLVDGSGLVTNGTSLFAADEFAGKIFKLNPDGNGFTTLTSGPRFAASFASERLITLAHEAGVLYVADAGRAGADSPSPQILSFPVAGSTFTTLASGAPLVSPSGIAQMAGKLYIADPGAGNTIWQLPIAGGTPTRYFGGAPFVGISGIAAYNGELYVADFAGGAIYRFIQTAATPPIVTTPPAAVATTNGATATFSVVATGIPAVAYQWRFNGNPIPNATNATLTLTNVQSAQVGTYSVTVANGVESITTTPVALTGPVVEPVFITQPAAYVSAAVGGSVTLSVAASSATSVNYQWRKHGQPVAGGFGPTLSLSNLTLFDAGLYDVVVTTNGVGFPSNASRLDVQAPIAAATLLTASPSFAPRFENDFAFFERLIRTPDGKIYISGNFSSLYGVLRPGFARLDAAGTLDTAFAPAPVQHPYNTARVYAVAAQADGRIIIGGAFSEVGGLPRDGLARLNADGSVDPTFAPPANLTNSDRVLALAIQPDGKILVAGSFNDSGVNIARLHADGTRDRTFAAGTGFSGSVNALVLQADGKLIAGGAFTSYQGNAVGYLVRLGATGVLDTAYKTGGGSGFDNHVRSLVLQPDGKLLVGGNFTSYGGSPRARLARVLDTGALDTTFSIGTGFNNDVAQLALQSDGAVIAVGDFTTFGGNTTKGIVRLTSTGERDITFVTSSELDASPGFNDGADGVALLANGVLVLSNDSSRYASPVANTGPLTRLTALGALDTSFAPAARTAGSVLALVPAPGGKWLVGGQFNRVNGTARGNLARLNSDYTLDQDFIPSGAGFGGTVKALAVQSDGKVLVGGAFATFNGLAANRLVRLTPAGPLDTTFDVGTGFDGEVLALALDASARVLVGGQFTSFNGTARNKLLRLTSAGALDTAFIQSGVGLGSSADVQALAVLSDGRFYVGGSFSGYAGTACYNVARFLADGALDSTFASGLDTNLVNSRVTSLLVQPDGKLLLGGQFYSVGTFSTYGLARLNADASRDTTFGAFESSGDITALYRQSDGRILVAGQFEHYGYSDSPLPLPRLARVDANGVVEPAFRAVGFAGSPNVIRADATGALLVGGHGLTFPGMAAAGLARLDAAVLPAIATAPVQQAVALGASASFSVTATGGGLAYQWTKDGVAVPGANGSALTFAAAQPADAGSYAVTVKNIFGSVTSAPVLLTGTGTAPVISAITSAPVTVGSAATLTATVTGATSYQWRKLGAPLTGNPSATTATLTLPAVTLADAGFYDLFAYNGLTRTRSAVARLVVQPSGTIQNPIRVDRNFAGILESSESYGLPTRILAQPDGSYYVAGNFTSVDGVFRFNLARFSAAGVADASFNAEVSGGSINALARQADGKLVLVGDFHRVNGIECNHIARLNTDGTIDSAFPQGPGTGTQDSLYAVAIQADQKILIGGGLSGYGSTFNLNHLARLNADGTLDTAFTTALQNGFNDTVRAIVVHTDGRIYVGGDFTQFNESTSANHLVALNPDGTRVALPGIVAGAFWTDNSEIAALGSVNRDDDVVVSTLVVQPDGKLIVGGNFDTFLGTSVSYIVGLTADGSLDPAFLNGVGFNQPVSRIIRQSDGALYAVGDFSRFDRRNARAVRLTATGALDRAYNFDSSVYDVALGAGGDLLVVGEFQTYFDSNGETSVPRSRFARFDAAGALTTSKVNRWGAPEGYLQTIVAAPGGKWLVAGYFNRLGGARVNYLARLNADGSLDSTFSTVQGPFNAPRALAVQGDGKILVGGSFDFWGNEEIYERTGRLVRLLPDGTRDTAFNHGFGFNFDVAAIVVQPDGKIVVGGDFNTFDGQRTGACLARLNADGTLDNSFVTGTGFDQSVRSLALQPDGKLLVAGDFRSYNSATSNVSYLVRLHTDGVLDTAYSVSGYRVSVIAPQADGGFLIGGSFNSLAGLARAGVARLTPTGAIDPAFNPGTLFEVSEVSIEINALAPQPDGRVIVSGYFEDLESVSGTGQLARLTATGALDTAFRPHFGGSIYAMVLRPDGSLLIAGSELTADETHRQGLLALGGNTVTAAPVITVPPVAVVAASGTTATFTVTASGDGLTYQWRRYGVPIPGATNATLNLPGVTLASADVYDVVIANSTGAFVTSTPVPLAVSPVVTPGALVLDDRFDLPFERELSDLASDAVTQVQALASGKFLVAGGFTRIGGVPRSRLARFNADGTVDPTFIPPAINAPVSRFVVQPDGKIVIAGDFYRVGPSSSGGLARLHGDGALDTAFPSASVSNVYALALQADGKILVGGQISSIGGSLTRPGVARFTTAGVPDATFDAGFNTGAIVRAIALQTLDATEKILLGGTFTTVGGVTRNNLARVTLTGALDATFSAATASNGPDAQVNAILAVDTAGAVVIGGNFATVNGVAAPRLARLAAADGALDPSFLSTVSGTVNGNVNALALQPSGDLVVAGSFTAFSGGAVRLRLARVSLTGLVDAAFAPTANSAVSTVSLQADGAILLGGSFNEINGAPRQHLARLSSAGVADAAVDPTLLAPAGVQALVHASGGGVLVGGSFTHVGGVPANALVRISAAGQLDATFNAGGAGFPKGTVVSALAPVGDGRVTVIGTFASYNGTARPRLLRLNGSGALDTVFAPPAGFTGFPTALLALPGGRVLLAGSFADYSGVTRNGLAVLNNDASLDTSFAAPTSQIPAFGLALARQPDGKILIGGDFTTYAGTAVNRLVRLNVDGTLDTAFLTAVGTGPNLAINALQTLPDGRLIVAGNFTTWNGNVGSTYAVRLFATGERDTGFQVQGSGFGIVSLILQADGKLIERGLSSLSGAGGPNPVFGFGRLDTTGGTDNSFYVPGVAGFKSGDRAMLQLDDGTLLVAGDSTLNLGGGFQRQGLARLIAFVGPAIVTPPVAQTSAAGATTTFSVVADGGALNVYQWFRGTTRLEGATSQVLVLKNLTTADAGDYTVQITNARGSVTSTPVALTVNDVPVITTQPIAQSAVFGGTATFSVVASGSPAPTYQWQLNGVDIPSATNSAYTITSASQDNAGAYRVVVTNSVGFVRSEPVEFAVVTRNLINFYARAIVAARGTIATSFTIEGTQPKTVLLVGVGGTRASTATFGGGSGFALIPAGSAALPPAGLADPRLVVVNAAGTLVGSNDNWTTANVSALTAAAAQVGATPGLSSTGEGANDAALLLTLAPGTYHATLDNADTAGGAALLQVYDADTDGRPRLVMFTLRANVASGDNVATAGFTIDGKLSKTVLIRALGEGLGASPGVLVDPVIELFRGTTSLDRNDDTYFSSGSDIPPVVGQVGARPVSDSLDSTLVRTLAPGAYTVQLTPYYFEESGTVLFELFEADAQRASVIAPVITYFSPNQFAVQGRAARFGVVVVAKPGATYQWRKNGALIDGAVNPVLTLDNVQSGDATSYDVVVTSGASSVTSASRTLSILPEFHSADSDRDRRIGLLELTRIIQFYNYRVGTVRTGEYRTLEGTEDGFTLGAGEITTHHTADSNRDGRIDIVELTRMIELFNYRNGTARTGEYHAVVGTEDGFTPGPDDSRLRSPKVR